MKILFLSGLYPPHTKGGGEISTHLIAKGLIDLGYELLVFTESRSGQRIEEQYEGVRVIRLPLPLTAKSLNERSWAKRMARQLAPEIQRLGAFDLIHTHDYKMTLILSEMRPAFAQGFGASSPSLIATARDYAQISGTTNYVLADGGRPKGWVQDAFKNQRIKEASLFRKPFRLWQYLWNTPYRMRAFRRIPNQIFISHAQQDLIGEVQDLSDIRTEVIYNPVSDDYLNGPIVEGKAGQVLYVGRVEDYKGVGLLLEAWKEVAKTHPQVRLKIMGEGAQRENYELRIKNYGINDTVEFAGRVPNEKLRAVYDEARIVVAPHLWVEPFGRTVAEAMARGKVVVAANMGGPSEMIQNMQNGFLFERGSGEDLSAQLISALRLSMEARQQIGKAAQLWVGHHLSSSHIAEHYERFYSN